MVLVEYWWGISILDLVEYYLYPNDAFSKVLGKYLAGSILDLVECYLCLSDGFYFSTICINGSKKKLFIFFFSCVLGEKVGKKRVYALNINNLF